MTATHIDTDESQEHTVGKKASHRRKYPVMVLFLKMF